MPSAYAPTPSASFAVLTHFNLDLGHRVHSETGDALFEIRYQLQRASLTVPQRKRVGQGTGIVSVLVFVSLLTHQSALN